jgi:RNA polymerase sigma factor (TIGR02999 family)
LPQPDVTELLADHRLGRPGALDQAFSLVYDELRRLAHYQLHNRGRGKTLNSTALVHELYLKLVDADQVDVENRRHLLSLASQAMRQIIVDHARTQSAQKRGGDLRRVPLDSTQIPVEDQAAWILTVDAALTRIRNIDERLEKVFECRYFAGMSEEETAAALDTSVRTVQRDWRRAKAWLRESLADSEE